MILKEIVDFIEILNVENVYLLDFNNINRFFIEKRKKLYSYWLISNIKIDM